MVDLGICLVHAPKIPAHETKGEDWASFEDLQRCFMEFH
jgi:hypothetical protein